MVALKFSTVASALSGDTRQAALLARQAGFDGLQFDAFAPPLRVTELTGSGRREFLHMLAAQNQELAGLRADAGPEGFGPGADLDRLLHQFGRLCETARALQAKVVCLDVGPLPEPPSQPKAKPAVTQQQAGLILLPDPTAVAAASEPEPAAPPPDPALIAQTNAALAALGEVADRYSTVVALRSELASFAALEQVMRRVNCPWFGIDLDPVAVLRDRWDIEEVFARLGPHVRHVRGRDATAGTDRRTKPAALGRGDVPWPDLLRDLDAAGFAGWLTVDPTDQPDRAAAAVAGLKFLKGLTA